MFASDKSQSATSYHDIAAQKKTPPDSTVTAAMFDLMIVFVKGTARFLCALCTALIAFP